MSDAIGGEDSPTILSPGRARLIDSYCRWASERAMTAYALLPASHREALAPILDECEHVSPLWCTDDGVSPPPGMGHRGQVWIVNGRHLPIVDWQAARSAVRRPDAEVLIFGSSSVSGPRYSESVLVSETGEVVRFKRHYCDSPVFADVWNGEASLLVASGRRVPAILTHVLTRGWGLESVGALTRRFSVQWSSAPCVLSEFEMTASIGEIAALGEPRQSPRNLCEVGAQAAIPLGAWRSDVSGSCRISAPHRAPREPGWPDTDVPTVEVFRHAGAIPDDRLRDGAAVVVRDHPLPDVEETGSVSSSVEGPGGDLIYLFLKRGIDLLASATGLILLSPILVVVAFLVKVSSPGPALYAHRRQGLGGKEFRCLKFRTMHEGASALQDALRKRNEVDGPQFKIGQDPRVTKIGPWLRQFNIDELPQLLNVLLGQMSLVGPRPSPDDENQLCPAWRRTRLSVKPGITGLWQVLRLRSRYVSDFQEWIYYDVEYARHRSLWLDFQILLYTPFAMFAPRRLRSFAERLERHGICTRAAALRRHYEGRANR